MIIAINIVVIILELAGLRMEICGLRDADDDVSDHVVRTCSYGRGIQENDAFRQRPLSSHALPGHLYCIVYSPGRAFRSVDTADCDNIHLWHNNAGHECKGQI